MHRFSGCSAPVWGNYYGDRKGDAGFTILIRLCVQVYTETRWCDLHPGSLQATSGTEMVLKVLGLKKLGGLGHMLNIELRPSIFNIIAQMCNFKN